jgi:hypothetical protein
MMIYTVLYGEINPLMIINNSETMITIYIFYIDERKKW